MPTFGYQIVSGGGQALIKGSLYIDDIESAKRHIQTVTAPGVVAMFGLEVILLDAKGMELWRGPYLGNEHA